jgi:hypothetical protein
MAIAASLLLALVITYNPGGHIINGLLDATRAKAVGETVVINGYCASACTLHLINPKSCATKRAVLLFHAASNRNGTRALMKLYPPRVRAYVTAHGGLTKRPVIVRGRAAQRLIGAC